MIKYIKRLLHSKGYLRHVGLKYKCPICGFWQSELRPFVRDGQELCEVHIVGNGRRLCNCWKCGSSDRERLVYLYCDKELNVFKTHERIKILHIAPETNLSNKFRKNKNLIYEAGDFFAEGYSYPDWVQNVDVTDIHREDNTYDLLICCHVLEHVGDYEKALKEIYRVLKPNGRAILQVPICLEHEKTEEGAISEEERWRKYGQGDHLRLFGRDYKDILAKAGFKVEVIGPNPKYFKYGVNKEEPLYVVRK